MLQPNIMYKECCREEKNVTMIPHKSKLGLMDESTQANHVRIVDVSAHNEHFKEEKKLHKISNPDEVLAKIRRRHKKGILRDSRDNVLDVCQISKDNSYANQSNSLSTIDEHVRSIDSLNFNGHGPRRSDLSPYQRNGEDDFLRAGLRRF